MTAGGEAYAQRRSRRHVSPRVHRALFRHEPALSTTDRRQAWESARDDAHLAFRLWCHAPYGAKREAYAAYRAAADREDVATAALATT